MLQLFYPSPHPSIDELGRPELKLAGLRLDAQTNARSRMTSYAVGMTVVPAGTVVPTEEGSPADLTITGFSSGLSLHFVSWSPDSKLLAFATVSPGREGDPPRGPLQLWVADVATGAARPLMGERRLNSVFEDYDWLDDTVMVASVLVEGRPDPPQRPKVWPSSRRAPACRPPVPHCPPPTPSLALSLLYPTPLSIRSPQAPSRPPRPPASAPAHLPSSSPHPSFLASFFLLCPLFVHVP